MKMHLAALAAPLTAVALGFYVFVHVIAPMVQRIVGS
jgi:hypothetical protein